jgi:endonuclease YncB( thermonuclease family)
MGSSEMGDPIDTAKGWARKHDGPSAKKAQKKSREAIRLKAQSGREEKIERRRGRIVAMIVWSGQGAPLIPS